MTESPFPDHGLSLSKCVRAGLAAIGLVIATSAYSQSDDALTRARDLLAARQPAAAFVLLEPLESARAGQPAFDYLLGIAALDSGRTTRAIFALERVLESEPSNALARAELARAYLVAGESETARQELERARAGGGIPDAALAGIDRMLSTIGQLHALQRTQWRAYAEVGLGYDTNVNNATGQGNIALPAFPGITFTLDPANLRRHDSFAFVGAGGSFRSPVSPDLVFSANLAANKAFNASFSEFEVGTLDAQAGLAKTVGANVFSAALQLNGNWQGQDRFRVATGVLGQWQHSLSSRDQITVFVQSARLEYPSNRVRDADRRAIGAGYARAFDNALIGFVSGYVGAESARAAGVPHLGHELAGVRAGLQFETAPRVALFANASHEERRYGGGEPAFGFPRRDRQSSAAFGLHYTPAAGWRLTPQVSVSDNRSNVSLYAFRKVVASLTLRHEF